MKTYNSSLAPYISGLIIQKQNCGYIYEYEAYILEKFDNFCIEHRYNTGTITREMVLQWAIQRPTEGKNYRNQRVSFVRQLALYMQSLGIESYIPKHFESEIVTVPHIFSKVELLAFFSIVDAYIPPQPSFQRMNPTYKVMFRLFYCCGLRLAEVCYLKRSCVNLKKGILKILKSKGDKSRLVYLAKDVLDMCRKYDTQMQALILDREWFFPGWSLEKPFLKNSIDKKFRQFWGRTPYADKVDKKPTVNSLRHTFVVNKMNEWMLSGVDINTMIPYLSRYLGHSSIKETYYYYHTIEQVFPVIRKHNTTINKVIPEVKIYDE